METKTVQTAMWGKYEVKKCWGSSDLSSWDFGPVDPWMCDDKSGEDINIVIPNWDYIDGDHAYIEVGLSFTEMIKDYINISLGKEDPDGLRKETAINCLKRAIKMLEAE